MFVFIALALNFVVNSPQMSKKSKKATSSKLGQKPGTPVETPAERERFRDIIVLIIAYPLSPTEGTDKLAGKKPVLEVISLLLKVALAAYALYEGVAG